MFLQRFAMILGPVFSPDLGDTGGGSPDPAPSGPAPVTGLEPSPELLDFGGRKVPVADPVIRDLHTDWQNQQRELTRLRQEFQRTQAALQAFAAGQNPTAEPAQPAGPTPEEEEAFLAEFYENPLAALSKWGHEFVGQAVLSRVEPFIQQQEFGQQLNDLAGKYPDLSQVMPAMNQVLEQYPEMAKLPNAMERIYWMAKGMAGQAAPAVSPDQLLNDPAFQARVAAHEGIRNQIISAYLSGKQSQASGLPPAPSAMVAGVAPAAPPNTPTSLRQGTKSFLARMGVRS